jgi:hypothetical protein
VATYDPYDGGQAQGGQCLLHLTLLGCVLTESNQAEAILFQILTARVDRKELPEQLCRSQQWYLTRDRTSESPTTKEEHNQAPQKATLSQT